MMTASSKIVKYFIGRTQPPSQRVEICFIRIGTSLVEKENFEIENTCSLDKNKNFHFWSTMLAHTNWLVSFRSLNIWMSQSDEKNNFFLDTAIFSFKPKTLAILRYCVPVRTHTSHF